MSGIVVDRAEFEEKLILQCGDHSGSNRSVWNKVHEEKVVAFLSEAEDPNCEKNASHHYYSKYYELLKIGFDVRVILKREKTSDPLIQVLAIEDYYDKLLEAHVQTGHGGRDKMMYYAQNKWKISKKASQLFVSCCQTCNRKRVTPRSGIVIKPIVSDGFNMRGQVDLIDFQSCPDGEFKWIMNYQDHGTKFVHLRPLKSKHAANVAMELRKIFFTWGSPQILQSDNGREFVAAVIDELVSQWPNTRIVHGRPRHPQSQGSVERANADVENMLRAWMIDNKSTNWSEGCYEVQV